MFEKQKKKEKKIFFFKSQPRSTYVNNKIYTEFCAFLLKSWVKTLVSLLNKLLANFPQEQLRRIQIVCWSMIIFIINWKCYAWAMLLGVFYCFYKTPTSGLLFPWRLNSAIWSWIISEKPLCCFIQVRIFQKQNHRKSQLQQVKK